MLIHQASHQDYWSAFSIEGLKIKAKALNKGSLYGSEAEVPPYFWGEGLLTSQPIHAGYAEARRLIGNGTADDLESLSVQAQAYVAGVFADVETKTTSEISPLQGTAGEECLSSPESGPKLVQLRLSSELQRWKSDQHAAGKILPPKGVGLASTSTTILEILGATGWHEALKTTDALYGCGMASLLMGAADAPTMLSNYVTDMAFYYEHGYHYVYPSLEPLFHKGLDDPHALRTQIGRQRRDAVRAGKKYIQSKMALEKQHIKSLTNRSARMTRRTAQIVCLSESSLLGMAAEATARGFDSGAVMSDLVFSSPGTDVVDVGSDLVNSEVMNSFLNVADIVDTGVVSEDVLRRVYDAYAVTGARLLTQRWHEPVARMCALLYTWHIQNDRHMFLRRALLGWPKARKTPTVPQREADFDEVFDEQYRTTGFSRPLDKEYSCNGQDTCNFVRQFLSINADDEPLLGDLWSLLVTGPLDYVRRGEVDEQREKELEEASRLLMARLYSRGRVLPMVWLVAHANHHAWQVNYLFEAAMFGSILDGGKLVGKLDRQDED